MPTPTIILIYPPPYISSYMELLDEMANKNIKDEITMEKYHYSHFLRLNNRKKHQNINDVVKSGYYHIDIKNKDAATTFKLNAYAHNWCRDNLSEGSYVSRYNHFCFAYEKDAIHFSIECMGLFG